MVKYGLQSSHSKLSEFWPVSDFCTVYRCFYLLVWILLSWFRLLAPVWEHWPARVQFLPRAHRVCSPGELHLCKCSPKINVNCDKWRAWGNDPWVEVQLLQASVQSATTQKVRDFPLALNGFLLPWSYDYNWIILKYILEDRSDKQKQQSSWDKSAGQNLEWGQILLRLGD